MTLREIFLTIREIPEEVIEAVSKEVTPFEAKKNSQLVEQGKLCDKIYFFSSGMHRVRYVKEEREDTICFGSEGEVFLSFQSFIAGKPSLFSVYCHENVCGWFIENIRFKALLRKHHELALWWSHLLAGQFYAFEQLYSLFSLADAEQRIENFWNICDPSLQHSESKEIYNKIPAKYLAQYIGITPQSMSRLRRKIVRARMKKSIKK